MEQFIQQIINAPHKEILVVMLVVCAFFYLVINKPLVRLFGFVNELKLRDVGSDQMRLLLEKDNFSNDLTVSLVEHFESLAFYKAYGMKADKEMRTVLLEFYSQNKKDISWRDLKGAYKDIRLDESLSIKVKTKFISELYQFFLNISVIVTGLLILVSAVNYFLFDDSDQAGLFFGFSVLYSVLFNFIHDIEWRPRSVNKIKVCIEKTKVTNLKEGQAL